MPDVPRSDRFDDVYFSADDGPAETAHVFLNGNNLPQRWQGADRFVIGETGFGTGLNFLLAWELFVSTAQPNAMLDFISVEKYPMSVEEIRQGLSPWADRLSPNLDKMLARYPLRVPGFHRVVFDNRIVLTLVFDDANDTLPQIEGQVDAWFLDGFTPSKNPEMWTQTVFDEMARLSHDNTTFATFTSAGFVKRGLQAAGFHVEKRRGFGRKRDMLAGHCLQGEKRITRKPDTVGIAGAGLAGCALAYVLPQYGLKPALYDPNGIASGASGNIIGLINPRLGAYRTAESDFYTAGFAMAAGEFPHIPESDYRRCGSLHLITDAEKGKKFSRAVNNWGWGQSHMRLLDASAASSVADVVLTHDALYLPDAGNISPALLCKAYTRSAGLVADLPENGVTVFAHGASIASDPDFSWLPVNTVRGQVTLARDTVESTMLKTNLCYGGYIAPAKNGTHVIGSTFQKWITHTNPLPDDDAANLDALSAVAPSLGALECAGHRAGLRLSAKDRFPVVGPLPGNRDGGAGFLSTAYGSHGIIGSLLGAHILADYMRGGPFCIGKSTLNALLPSRFQVREIRRAAKKS